MKCFRVATARKWLYALDPLEPGRAHLVRTEWRHTEKEATDFPSYMYAEAVSANAPPTTHRLKIYRVHDHETDPK